MATWSSIPFAQLTRLASDFVMSQKGFWDHTAWTNFLSRVQRQGIEISTDMQWKLGDLLEAMKEYHMAVSSTEDVEKAMTTVLAESVAFIERQKGVWGHAEWEDFVKTMRQNTRIWSDGMEAYLGGVLESLKVFYALSLGVPVEKLTTAAPEDASQESGPVESSKPPET